ncbi:MAG: SPOR domain-containing protein [Gammaproteobacteria bacterium]|nr:SPOR domain-containing protein [Gammaproteobacteria bacterium]
MAFNTKKKAERIAAMLRKTVGNEPKCKRSYNHRNYYYEVRLKAFDSRSRMGPAFWPCRCGCDSPLKIQLNGQG